MSKDRDDPRPPVVVTKWIGAQIHHGIVYVQFRSGPTAYTAALGPEMARLAIASVLEALKPAEIIPIEEARAKRRTD